MFGGAAVMQFHERNKRGKEAIKDERTYPSA
jgi:hypothetical protein